MIIVGCGMVSQYNLPPAERYGPKNIFMLVLKRLTLQGFIIADPQILSNYMVPFLTNMMKWIHEGKIKPRDHVVDGIDNAVNGFLGMLKGDNFGKAVLKIANVDDK